MLNTWESGSEIRGDFLNEVLVKDGDQLDRSCEKCGSVALKRGWQECPNCYVQMEG